MTYSLDLREKALEYLEKVGNREQVVAALNIALRTLEGWIRRKRENCLSPKQRRSSLSKIDDQKLRLFIEEHPDAYLREIAESFGVTLRCRLTCRSSGSKISSDYASDDD